MVAAASAGSITRSPPPPDGWHPPAPRRACPSRRIRSRPIPWPDGDTRARPKVVTIRDATRRHLLGEDGRRGKAVDARHLDVQQRHVGQVAFAAATISSPLPTDATTLKSSSRSSSAARAERMSSWSSASRSRMVTLARRRRAARRGASRWRRSVPPRWPPAEATRSARPVSPLPRRPRAADAVVDDLDRRRCDAHRTGAGVRVTHHVGEPLAEHPAEKLLGGIVDDVDCRRHFGRRSQRGRSNSRPVASSPAKVTSR